MAAADSNKRIRPRTNYSLAAVVSCVVIVVVVWSQGAWGWSTTVVGSSSSSFVSSRMGARPVSFTKTNTKTTLSPPSRSRVLLRASRQRSSRRTEEQGYDEYYDKDNDKYYYDDEVDEENSSRSQRTKAVQEAVEDVEDDYDGYWSTTKRDEEQGRRQDKQEEEGRKVRGGMYKVYFESDIDPIKETQLDWEVVSATDEEDQKLEALVLLPPEAVERPTAIIHFCGGTFFGSAPKLWYRSFLEGLVRNTQCAIVCTPIPVTILKSPLQHISLSQRLQASFDYAWENVLEDEYGEKLADVPMLGMGHSLGARLMVVLTTLTQNKPSRRRQGKLPIPAFKSLCLISFTNYGAAAGIPGVSTLLRQSKTQEQTVKIKRERDRRRTSQRERQDWWIDSENDDGEYENEDPEEEWEELVEDLQDLFQEQAGRVRKALTPDSKDLEFYPTPDMLWKAIQDDRRYKVPETLVVQFDDDPIDQSSKLAQTLQATNSSDVRFARLRGTHLTPVSVEDEGTSTNSGGGGGWLGLSSRASKTVWKAVKGRSKSRAQAAAMRDLRQSVARYISDVVTK